MLTDAEKEAYIFDRGMHCPDSKCLSENITGEESDFDDNLVYVYCHCHDCGIRWIDRFRLENISEDEPE